MSESEPDLARGVLPNAIARLNENLERLAAERPEDGDLTAPNPKDVQKPAQNPPDSTC